jgi:hypothetical protein
MIRHHLVWAAIGLLWFGLLGCETVLGLSATDPTLMQAGGHAGVAGQAGSAGAPNSSAGVAGAGG